MEKEIITKAKEIIAKHHEKIRETGEEFNIISLLNMENNERYTHSAIIAEMLNPKGKHQQQDKFLNEFLRIINLPNFNRGHCKVRVEEYAGVVQHKEFSSRTFIDITVKNDCGEEVLIENKIWAIDQPYQLERIGMNRIGEKCTVIYLTPFGHKYVGKVDFRYKCISYQDEISKWLKACIEISPNEYLKNTIITYKNIVDKITNQNLYSKMATDIKDLIKKDQESFIAALNIYNNFKEIDGQIKNVFWKSMRDKLAREYSATVQVGNYKYEYEIDENSSDQLYLQIRFVDENGATVLKDEFLNSKIEILRSEFSSNAPDSNKTWNIWFFANRDNQLHNNFINDLPTESKYQLLMNNDFDNQIADVSQDFDSILKRLDELLAS